MKAEFPEHLTAMDRRALVHRTVEATCIPAVDGPPGGRLEDVRGLGEMDLSRVRRI